MSLLNPAAPDFSDPLGLLAACHQRILGFCELLQRLGPWIEANGIDADATDGARSVLRYFSTAAPLHHDDEELDLFPMLADEHSAGVLIDRLCEEHRELEQRWANLALQLEGLLNGRYDREAFEAAVTPFGAGYRRHIRDEEELLLKVAKNRLSRTQLRGLGESMAARRQPSPNPAEP